jgi:hypothetical protein
MITLSGFYCNTFFFHYHSIFYNLFYSVAILLVFLFYFRTILTGTAQKFNQTVAASQAQKEYVENLGKQSNI